MRADTEASKPMRAKSMKRMIAIIVALVMVVNVDVGGSLMTSRCLYVWQAPEVGTGGEGVRFIQWWHQRRS